MTILAIETSCDETSAAVIKIMGGSPPRLAEAPAKRGFGEARRIKILANIVSSQIEIHKEFGGVVPEVAARHHVQNIGWVINEAMVKAGIKPKQVDLLAVTAGPGLITSLIVGVEAAKTLSVAWRKPLLAVNHLYGHIAANFLNPIKFPALCLVVSGGHTELVLLKNYWQFKKIGQTIDDAAGEAFDKVAKLLGLGYPGGPIISQISVDGDSAAFKFPRPMIESPNFNFSFSGLKTAVLYASQKLKVCGELSRTIKNLSPTAIRDLKIISDICASFQQATVDVLAGKTIRAAKKFKVKTIMLAGGVAANKFLRETLRQKAIEGGFEFLAPELKLCTDNALMIAIAAYYLSLKKMPAIDNWRKIKADPNWELN